MRMKIAQYIFLILNLVVFCLEAKAQESVQFWVTKNFSQETLFRQEILLEHESVMELLKGQCMTQTSYAGAFVNQINGIPQDLKLEKNKSWFYYVNGLLADVGALGYFPEAGDHIWWDFHRWDDAVYISSVIGAYPQPFLSGYGKKIFKTMIVATDDLLESAEELKLSLQDQGVLGIEVKPFSLDPFSDTEAKILIGPWEKIQNNPTIQDVVKNYRKTGFFIQFKDSKLIALNIEGREAAAFDHAAAILATGSGFHMNGPLWIITGTNTAQVQEAVQLLMDHPERIQHHAGVVLNQGEVIHVPVFTKK